MSVAELWDEIGGIEISNPLYSLRLCLEKFCSEEASAPAGESYLRIRYAFTQCSVKTAA